jgi:pyridoxamine 5'-phosphate oxidase family protein
MFLAVGWVCRHAGQMERAGPSPGRARKTAAWPHSFSTCTLAGMRTFTHAETEYLTRGLLGRLATVGPDGRPHVTPLAVFFDPQDQTLVIGGHAGTHMARSKKFRDARRHPDVAVVVDDVASVDPWMPRYLEIRGHATTHLKGGEEVGRRLGVPFPFDPAWIRVRPRRVVAYGIEAADELAVRDVA